MWYNSITQWGYSYCKGILYNRQDADTINHIHSSNNVNKVIELKSTFKILQYYKCGVIYEHHQRDFSYCKSILHNQQDADTDNHIHSSNNLN